MEPDCESYWRGECQSCKWLLCADASRKKPCPFYKSESYTPPEEQSQEVAVWLPYLPAPRAWGRRQTMDVCPHITVGKASEGAETPEKYIRSERRRK